MGNHLCVVIGVEPATQSNSAWPSILWWVHRVLTEAGSVNRPITQYTIPT